MPAKKSPHNRRLEEAISVLKALCFRDKQCNETAALTLLALLDLKPRQRWSSAKAPLLGITPIIAVIKASYGVEYAPNTRETIRDDAVKHFVEAGLLLRNPDDPSRPTNSGKTVYQLEPSALELLRHYGASEWETLLVEYHSQRIVQQNELHRQRLLNRVAVEYAGRSLSLSPGGQNPLIKSIIEQFCPAFVPGAKLLYLGDTESKFTHLDRAGLSHLGIGLNNAAKVPDVIVHHEAQNWLVLIEAVTTAGPVDGKRRKELKNLFSESKAGLVFVTAFENRKSFQRFVGQIAWETEVWIAEDPDHLIHFNGERFLGPYPDVVR